MPSVDPRAAQIIRTIEALEASVAAAEPALAARDWPRLNDLLDAQHRLTAALSNALHETRDVRPPAFSDEVCRRLAGISERRDDQLRRLIAFNHLVKQRLTMMARSREMRRHTGSKSPAPRLINTMR